VELATSLRVKTHSRFGGEHFTRKGISKGARTMANSYDGGFASLRRLRNEMDHLLGGLFPSERDNAWASEGGYPPVNVWDDVENLYVEAEIPGLRREDLEISALGNEVAIKGHRPDVLKEGETYHRQERAAGAFSRALRLPMEIDPDKIEASLNQGVLLIKLPKAAAAKARRIEVKTS
jgi:HSP20 family protein